MKRIILTAMLASTSHAQVVPECKDTDPKQGPIYQCCPKEVVKTVIKKVPEIKIVKETKIVEKPTVVEKQVVITKEVPASSPKYNVSLLLGIGDNGVKTVLYDKTEYEFKKDFGLIGGVHAQALTSSGISFGVGALTNSSFFGSIGISFGSR